MFSFPHVQILEPATCGALTVFPLETDAGAPVDYVLADEAIETDAVVVTEISSAGSVPELAVENHCEKLVLFIEGQQLIGAKQNRVLNVTTLVPGGKKTVIPVSCVEHGRWSAKSKKFSASKNMAFAKLRHGLKKSVNASLKRKGGHRSDQSQVWEDVAEMESDFELSSPTSAMEEAYEAMESNLENVQSQIVYRSNSSGVAVAVGGAILAVELFDRPATCEKLWNRLLSGFALEAMRKIETAPVVQSDVGAFIDRAAEAKWEKVKAVAEGKEYRVEFDNVQGAALAYQKQLIHLSLSASA